MKRVALKWLPVIDLDNCTGCCECVEACGPKCLEIANNDFAVLARADLCGSEEHCVEPCPEDAINMEWIEIHGDESVGKWNS